MTVCKQNRAVSRKFQPVNISSHFAKFESKNAQSLDILLPDTNVSFQLLGCGLFSQFILC